MPYTALRIPSKAAAPAAAIGLPPPAITPMNANWEPPEKSRMLSAQVCNTVKPDATDSAPNETPYRPVATAIDRPTLAPGELRRVVGAGLRFLVLVGCAVALVPLVRAPLARA